MCKTSSDAVPVGDGKISATLRKLVPDHPACWEALALAEEKLPVAILNHSFRTFIYAKAFLETQASDRAAIKAFQADYVSPVRSLFGPLYSIFVACILHDLGVSSDYDKSPERFEIIGGDLTAEILRKHGADEELIHETWLATVLHDTPGIPRRLGGSIRAVRLAIEAEFSSLEPEASHLPENTKNKGAVEVELPRLDIEKVLGDAVVRQALLTPEKAPASCWPGNLLRAKRENPDWDGVNKGFSG